MRKPGLKKLNSHGFTLIEVVLVMAVITILIGIALPSLRAYARNAKNTERTKRAENVENAIRQYFAYEGAFPDLPEWEESDWTAGNCLHSTQLEGDDGLINKLKTVSNINFNIETGLYNYNENTGEFTYVDPNP